MSEMTLQQNQILNMHINTADDSDSSSDDVFIELANAWSYVKKWYQFRNRPGSDLGKEGKVMFSRSKSRITKEPDARNLQNLALLCLIQHSMVIANST